MAKIEKKLAQEIGTLVNEHYRKNNEGDKIGVTVNIRADRNRVKMPDNVMLMQTFAHLACTKLNSSTNRILMYFFSLQAYENFLSIDVYTICDVLSMSKPTVTKALKELEKNNIIIKLKHPSDKRRHDYFINPMSSWKGNSYARQKMILTMDKNQLSMFPETEKLEPPF